MQHWLLVKLYIDVLHEFRVWTIKYDWQAIQIFYILGRHLMYELWKIKYNRQAIQIFYTSECHVVGYVNNKN